METFIKQEPFDDFVAKEEIKAQSCCLCEKGKSIQDQLLHHFREKHHRGKKSRSFMRFICGLENNYSDISLDFRPSMKVNICSCPESFHLQLKLINHLLSHIPDEAFNHETDELHFAEPIIEIKYEDKECSNDSDDKGFPVTIVQHTEAGKVFPCALCPKKLKSKEGLMRHSKIEHNPLNPYKCSSCEARFRDIISLKLHEKFHYIEDGFNTQSSNTQCPVCHKSFQVRNSLLKHMNRHFCASSEKYRKPYYCDLCPRKWPAKNNLRQHIINVHMKKEILVEVGEIEIRQRRSRSDTTGKIICDQCSVYVHPSSMRQHIFNHHNKASAHVCDHPSCDARFLFPSGLQKHKERHQGIKKMECKFCGEKFNEKGNLNKHLLRHTNPDKFKCSECSKLFVNARSLKLHERVHVADDGTRPYGCEQCEAAFKYPDLLRNHFNRAHKGKKTYKTSIYLVHQQ